MANPRKKTRFKPGQSGNPKGRPKGQPSFNELFLREAGRLVKVETADGVKAFTKVEVVIRKLFHAASAGDLRSAALVMSYLARVPTEQESPDDSAATASFKIPDEEAIRRMLARFKHLEPAPEARK